MEERKSAHPSRKTSQPVGANRERTTCSEAAKEGVCSTRQSSGREYEMIPVPNMNRVECAWVEIRGQGFSLHGFLVFLTSDHFFPQYLENDGLGDLDMWTGRECGVFVVQSPSAAWIEYTRKNNHPWWQLFGHLAEENEEFAETLEAHGDARVVSLDGRKQSLREAFAPCLNHFQYAAEIEKVLYRFNLDATDHPGLILFTDWYDPTVWYVDMRDLVDIPERDLRQSLHRWFSGPEFKKILSESKNARS